MATVTIQTTALRSLSALHLMWGAETRTAWDAHARSPLSIKAQPDALTRDIYKNAARRLRREGRIIEILGLLLGAWKTHLESGLASSPAGGGPSLYSDVRILNTCREAYSGNGDRDGKDEGEDEMIKKLLEESEVLTGDYKGKPFLGADIDG